MQFIKEMIRDFRVVPSKKLLTLAMFFSCILGYVVMAFFPYFASEIIKYATQNLPSLAFQATLFLGISYIVYEIIFYFNYLFYSKLQYYYTSALYQKLFHKIKSSSRHFSKGVDKGKVLTLVGDDIPSFCLLLDSVCVFLSTIFMVILVFILVMRVHIIFGLVLLVSSILYILFVTYTTKQYTKYVKIQKMHHDKTNDVYIEELKALKEIKTLPIQKQLQRKLTTILNRYTKATFKKTKYQIHNENTSTIFPQYTKVLLYIILLLFMMYFNAKIELVILIIGYYDQLIESLTEMLTAYQEIKEYSISVERVSEVLTFQDDIGALFGNYEGNEIYGAITFDRVSYQYNSRTILDQISFSVKPNTLNVIVGESGSGKTTIFDLLLRFYPLDNGKIYLDSRNIYDYSSDIYASNITVVKQNPYFYNMSIYQNLRLVNGNRKEQIQACQEVGIHEFIMSLEKNYKTILHQNARNLSGGQKQLLAIARALLTNAEILLMDDVTASLDPKTTSQIVSLLKCLKEDHTLLVVTNRDDLIKVADQIIYLEKGQATCYHSQREWLEFQEAKREGEAR